MFKHFTVGAVALTLAMSMTAQAASLPPVTGSYQGAYNVESARTGSNDHSFWLPNFLGSGATNYWQFDTNGGLFVHSGTTATLTGRIQNNVQSNAYFDVDVSFSFLERGGRAPKCEFGSTACNSPSYKFKSDHYDYFDMGAATLTGEGDLAGLILSLAIRPANGSFPLQVGYGANNKDIDAFGGSSWFFWSVVQNTNGVAIGSDTRGDINIALSPVPIPASLPLLLAAIAGLGFAARRRRRAAA